MGQVLCIIYAFSVDRLKEAVQSKDIEKVKALVIAMCDRDSVEQIHPKNITNALHAVIKEQSLDDDGPNQALLQVIQLFVEAGADLHMKIECARGHTPVTLLLDGNYSIHLKSVVKLLAENGCDINMKVRENEKAALHFAASYGYTDIARMLLRHDAEINMESDDGTAFQIAVEKGHTETAQLFLEQHCALHTSKSLSTVLQTTFKRFGEKLYFALKIQEAHWGKIAEDIRSMQENHKEQIKYWVKNAKHQTYLEKWQKTLVDIPFEDMIKIPEFIARELDASVRYLPSDGYGICHLFLLLI